MRPEQLVLLIFYSFSFLVGSPLQAQDATKSADAAAIDEVVYWDQARAVLQKRCFACHRGDQPRGGLDTTSLSGLNAGSTSGAVIVSGLPLKSPLFLLAAHLEEPTMPPNSPRMPQRELDVLQKWIEHGLQTREIAENNSDSGPGPERSMQRRPREFTSIKHEALPFIPPRESSVVSRLPGASKTDQLKAALSVSPRPVQNRPPLANAITDLGINPTSSQVAVAAGHSVFVFHWPDQSLQQILVQKDGDVFCVRYSVDGQLLLIAGGIGATSGYVNVVDARTGEHVFQVTQPDDVVLAADLSPSGGLLAFGGPNRRITLQDTVKNERIAELGRHTDWILNVKFSPDGLLLATADRFGSIQVWEAATGSEFGTLRGHTGPVTSLHWRDSADRLISTGQDGTKRTWDMHQIAQEEVQDLNSGSILAAGFYPDGRLVTGGRSGQWKISSVASVSANGPGAGGSSADSDLVPSSSFPSLPADVTQIAFTQDGTHIVASDVAGNIRLFDAHSGRQMGSLSIPARYSDNTQEDTEKDASQ